MAPQRNSGDEAGSIDNIFGGFRGIGVWGGEHSSGGVNC